MPARWVNVYCPVGICPSQHLPLYLYNDRWDGKASWTSSNGSELVMDHVQNTGYKHNKVLIN